MNYNYGYTNGYNTPFYYNQQNPVQPQPMAQQPSQNELMVVLVKDDEAVQNYPVANGNSVMLMNYSSGKFWIKTMNGIAPTITEHKFEVINNDQNNTGSNSVSVEAFKKLSNKVNELQKFVDDLKS